MGAVKSKSRQEYEQAILHIVQALPLERVTQILDFARFIETQLEDELEETESEEEIAASEARWDELLARPEAQVKLLEMAEEALLEDDAGSTFEMRFDKQGNLVRPPRE